MIWFKHDSNAATDAKIKKLLIKYGAEGYAIYFHCIELIVSDISETNITFELEHDSEIIADDLKIRGTSDQSGQDRVNQIMKYIVQVGLFEENQGRISCYKILKRLDSSMTSNIKMRKMITDGKSNHDKVMTQHDSVMQDKKRRDKKRREESNTTQKKQSEIKHKYGEYEHVLLTDKEYKKLEESEIKHLYWIGKLDEGIEMKGYKYKSHYLAILSWHRNEKDKQKPNKIQTEFEDVKF